MNRTTSKQNIIHPFSRRRFLKLSATALFGYALPFQQNLSASKKNVGFVERAIFSMGSIVTIKANSFDERPCNRAIDEAFKEIKMIDTLMSVFDPVSQLSLVNRLSYEQEMKVDFRIIEILEQAQRFSIETNGAFDVTIEPLMKLYGFRDEAAIHPFPSDKQIAETLHGIGSHNITVNRLLSTVSLQHPATKLDFGGIAVGYALDRAASILRSSGIASALINHSGDIIAIGSPPDEHTWEIGIVDPSNTNRIITTVNIKNQALSTSGNYENYIIADGKTIGHILDALSGKNTRSLLSGTAIAPTCIEADALSTGFFVLGTTRTEQILNRTHNITFIAVTGDNNNLKITHF